MQRLDELRQAIISELDNLEWMDTPYVYNAVNKQGQKEKIIQDVTELVIRRRMDIGEAIIQLDESLNPSYSID